MGWALLALGAVALMHAADKVEASQAALTQAQDEERRLQRALHQARLGEQVADQRPRPAPGQADAPPLDQDGLRRAAQLAQWLAYPWNEVLDGADAAAQAHGAALIKLGLDITVLASAPAVQPEMTLQAALRDEAQALDWLAALGPRAALQSHERLTSPPVSARGTYALRVDARMAGGTP